MGLPVEKLSPMPFFARPPQSTLVGQGKTVRIPRSTKQFDWECELAVVIGKKLHHAARQQAADAIAGYTIGLDMTCRDLIVATRGLGTDLMHGKAQDTMAPCGPHFVPKQFVPDVNHLKIQLWVNDNLMMNSSTSEMLFKCDEIISEISESTTPYPGDIIFTGSPAGSAGVHGGCWLKPGDKIRSEIQDIGILRVEMVADD